jgi:hypothetical protein
MEVCTVEVYYSSFLVVLGFPQCLKLLKKLHVGHCLITDAAKIF